MEEKTIPQKRCELANMIAAGRVIEVLRQLKDMPLEELQSLSVAEMKCLVDCRLDEMDLKEIEKGLEKLNFYVCGILMHRILDQN